MGWVHDFKYPEGFNVLSDDDWDDFIKLHRKYPKKYMEWVHEDDNDGMEWKAIPGYPKYMACKEGFIKSVQISERSGILKPWTNNHGHYYVCVIDKDGNSKKMLVHRLIAMTFLENPNNYPIVRHLNDIPTDNRVENLAWGTSTDNSADMVRNGNDTHKNVYCYELDRVFRSCRDAADFFEVNRSEISMACRGIIYAVKGNYHICYADEVDDHLMKKEEWLRVGDRRKPIISTNKISGERLVFKSRKEAGKILKIPDCGISSVITGRINSTHGWMFEDLEVG